MRTLLGVTLAVMLSLVFAAPANAGSWVEHKSDKYPVSIHLWSTIDVQQKEWANGWGGLKAKNHGLEIFAMVNKGKIKAADVQKLGVKITGVAAKDWNLTDKQRAGFKNYQVGTLTKGEQQYIVAWGQTAKGATMLFIVKSNAADLAKHERSYRNVLRRLKVG